MEIRKISNEKLKENLFLQLDELRKEVSRVSSSQIAKNISNATRDDLADYQKRFDYTIKLSFIQRDKIAKNLDEVGDSRLSYDVLRYVIECLLYDNDVKDLHFDFVKFYKSFKDEYCDWTIKQIVKNYNERTKKQYGYEVQDGYWKYVFMYNQKMIMKYMKENNISDIYRKSDYDSLSKIQIQKNMNYRLSFLDKVKEQEYYDIEIALDKTRERLDCFYLYELENKTMFCEVA